MIFKPEDAAVIEEKVMKIRLYTTKTESGNAAVLYQETQKGHIEEFLHEKRILFVISLKAVGSG